MLHLVDNIKIIRKLWGKTQTEFAKLFTGVTLNMQKSYETERAEPDRVYIAELAGMAGVTEENVMNKRLIKGDISKEPIQDDKDENGARGTKEGTDSAYKAKYIELLERENANKDRIINFNLTGLQFGLGSILAHIEVSLDQDAERDSGGDQKKLKQKLQEKDKRIREKIEAMK